MDAFIILIFVAGLILLICIMFFYGGKIDGRSWGAIIAAIVAILGVCLTNLIVINNSNNQLKHQADNFNYQIAHQNKILARQLNHQSHEKDLDRKISIRQEKYDELVEQIVEKEAGMARFFHMELSENYSESILKFYIKANLAKTVASLNVIKGINAFYNEFMPLYYKMAADAATLNQLKLNLESLKTTHNNSLEILKDMQSGIIRIADEQELLQLHKRTSGMQLTINNIVEKINTSNDEILKQATTLTEKYKGNIEKLRTLSVTLIHLINNEFSVSNARIDDE